MLEAIKKKFLKQAKATQQEVEMVEKPNEQAATLAVLNTAEYADLVAQLASQSSTLASVQAQFTELTAKLAAVEVEKAAMIASAHDKKMSTRKDRVETLMGTEKAPALLSATEALSDEQFDSIVSAMSSKLGTELTSKMFTEVGVAAEAKVDEVDPVQKLAESFAKQFNSK